MFISDFAIKRPLVTVVAMLTLVVAGLVALSRLQTDEFPDIQEPVILVGVLYPGASPDGVEREVLDPIEEAISGIAGVGEINGTAQDSYAQMVVFFTFGKDMQEASTEIRDAISAIRNDLPTEIEEPVLRRVAMTDFPVVQLTVTSPRLSTAQLTRIADDQLTRELRSVNGVARVDVVGARNRELSIDLRPDAMAALGVSAGEVVQAVSAQNIAAPVGRLNATGSEQTIRLEGRLERPEDFERIVVATGAGGRPVFLSEIASVSSGNEEVRSLALFNGREAVGVNVLKTRESSTTAVSQAVQAKVAELEATLPAGTQVNVINDSGVRVDASVRNVQMALIEGAFLTVLVVFLFLNSWRSTVITGVALPISVIASFVAVWAFGFTLNTMSLLGLSLAIGILIDDAIVVRENIVRHVEMGKDHLRAAHEGTAEIGLAVAATTFSIVAVFVPIAFLPGIGGQWFKPFALTIACSVLVSLFVSFSLDPMLSAYWPDPHVPEEKKSFITRALDRFNAWFDRMAHGYRGVIAWALDHAPIMVVLALASFVMAFALPLNGVVAALLVAAVAAVASLVLKFIPNRWYFTLPTVLGALALMVLAFRDAPASHSIGLGFVPSDDRSEFQISVLTPPGSDLAYTRNKVEEVARIARRRDEVLYTFATISSQSGSVNEGSIYVRLKRPDERNLGAQEVSNEVREQFASVRGVEASISDGFGGGRKQIQVQLQGTDSAVLLREAQAVLALVREVPGAVDVGLSTRGQRPELAIDIDRDQAAIRGVSVAQIAGSLRPAFAGIDAGDWVDPEGETRDVTVRYAPEYRTAAADLQWLPLRVLGPNGPETLSLSDVATVREGLGPALIQHLDGDPVISVEANVGGGLPLSEVSNEINTRLEALDLDGNAENGLQIAAGVSVSQGGEVEDQNEVFGSIFLALGSGVLLMYLVLVLQFGSFLDPITIMISLPLSLIGVMLALLVTGGTINIMSLIGVILLMGIVAKNAILLIDFAKDAQRQGLSTREALIEAGAVRLRPILMTTFALVAGMIPVAIGSGEGALFRRPLGVAVIGGTITLTFLTLLVIPTIYELIDAGRARFMHFIRRGRTPGAHGPHGGTHGPDGHPAAGNGADGHATPAPAREPAPAFAIEPAPRPAQG